MSARTSPAVQTRQCSRPTCGAEAVASMSYDHAGAVVFVGALVAERHPAYYDLCRTHLDRLTAPRGWTIRREPLHVASDGGHESSSWHEPRVVARTVETGS